MRNAWELAHQKSVVVEELEREIAILVNAKTESPSPDNQNIADARIADLRGKIAALKTEIRLYLTTAQGLAKDVAPYVNPRLANTDSRVSGPLTIVQRKF